jgi:hypothetical protein
MFTYKKYIKEKKIIIMEDRKTHENTVCLMIHADLICFIASIFKLNGLTNNRKIEKYVL